MQIINFLKKYKIFIILGIILVGLIILNILLKREEIKIPELAPSPIEKEREYEYPIPEKSLAPGFSFPPVSSPTISPSSLIPTAIPSPTTNKLNLVSAYPKQGDNETLFAQYKIYFTFNKEPDLNNLDYQINPLVPFKLAVEENELSFYPVQSFEFNVNYVLKINRLQSTDGKSLADPIEYQFRLIEPTDLNFGPEH